MSLLLPSGQRVSCCLNRAADRHPGKQSALPQRLPYSHHPLASQQPRHYCLALWERQIQRVSAAVCACLLVMLEKSKKANCEGLGGWTIYVSSVWQKRLHRTLRTMLSVLIQLKIALWKLQRSPTAAEETELKQLLSGQFPEEQIAGRDPEQSLNNPAGRNRAASGMGLSASLRAPPAAPPRGRGAAPHGQRCPARAPPAAPPGQRLLVRACGGASPQGNRRRGARTGARVQACTGGRARTQPRRVHGSTGAHGEARSPRPQPSPWSGRSSGCPGRGRWGRRGGSPASPSGRSRPVAGRCSIAAAARRCRRTLRSSCTPAPRKAAPARPPSHGGRAAGTQHPVSPSGPAAAVPAGREGLAAPPPPGAARAEAPLTAAAARPPRGPRGPRPAARHRAAPRLPPGPAGPRAARPCPADGSAPDGPQGTKEKAGPERRGCSQSLPRPGLPHAPKLAERSLREVRVGDAGQPHLCCLRKVLACGSFAHPDLVFGRTYLIGVRWKRGVRLCG